MSSLNACCAVKSDCSRPRPSMHRPWYVSHPWAPSLQAHLPYPRYHLHDEVAHRCTHHSDVHHDECPLDDVRDYQDFCAREALCCLGACDGGSRVGESMVRRGRGSIVCRRRRTLRGPKWLLQSHLASDLVQQMNNRIISGRE